MPAREYRQDKHLFWLGVHWEYAKDKNVVNGLRKKIREAKELAVLVNMGDEVLVGAVPRSSKPHYIGALLVANLLGSAIFVQNLDDTHTWLMVCESGHVLPGRDVVVDKDKVQSVLSEWMRDYSWLHIIGDVQGSLRSSSDCWKEIIDGIETKAFDSQAMQVVSQTRWQPIALVAVVVAVVVGAAIYFAEQMVARETDQPDKSKIIAMARRAVEEEVQRRLRQAFEQEKRRRIDMLMSRNAGSELEAIIRAVGSLPRPFAVKLHNAQCRHEGSKVTCVVSVQLPHQSSFAMRRAVVGDDIELVTNANPVVSLPLLTVDVAPSTREWHPAKDDWALLHILDDARAIGFAAGGPQVRFVTEVLQAASFQEGGVKLNSPDAPLWKKVTAQFASSVAKASALAEWLKRQPCALESAEIASTYVSAQVFCWRLLMEPITEPGSDKR